MITSRERLERVLLRKTADRIPVDMGATSVTGVHVRVVEQLRRATGLPYQPVKVIEPYQMLGEVDEQLCDALGIDVVGLWARKTMFGFENQSWREFRTFWGQVVLVPDGFQTTLDQNGDLLIYPEGDRNAAPSGRMPKASFFFDTIVRQEPLDEAHLDPQDNLEEFAPYSQEDLAHWSRAVARYRQTSSRGLIGSIGGTALGDIAMVPGPWMKRPRGVRDIAEWYMTLVARPDYVHAIFEKQTEMALANLEAAHRVIGDALQAVFLCGTDFGTQDSQFCSVDTFQELFLPYYRRMNDWIHRHTSWKVFKHSCGAVEPLIESFIEAGFDILNPVQVNAAGMDPRHLKERFGSRLVFWGGGVDTQKVLPFGTPEEVEAHVVRQCEVLGRDGGFVFNTVHNIQANVPVENVMAMVRGIRRANGS
ncbi:MAG TPA: uroporphyrinogen decarboxylase family protein [Anaeromyxobacter sp.]|nr:uroporphyrinogen decarboxylase family protein [Anaeromyxobacter sp.]